MGAHMLGTLLHHARFTRNALKHFIALGNLHELLGRLESFGLTWPSTPRATRPLAWRSDWSWWTSRAAYMSPNASCARCACMVSRSACR